MIGVTGFEPTTPASRRRFQYPSNVYPSVYPMDLSKWANDCK